MQIRNSICVKCDALAQICLSSGTVHKLCFSAAGGKAAYGNGASFSLPALVFFAVQVETDYAYGEPKMKSYITYLLL